MSRRFLRFATLASLLLATPALAQSFEDGLAAQEKRYFAHAAKIWRPLAEQGHAKAQYGLGVLYANGDGVRQSDSDAAHWLELSAKQGYGPAQISLARMYARGDGVKQNFAEAARWFRQAAEGGDNEAQTELGSLYNRGQGVARNDREAVKWFRQAAAKGYSPAISNLGYMYEAGQGVPKDNVKAHMFFTVVMAKTADEQSERAMANRERVGRALKPDQLQQSRSLARKCMESDYQQCE